jgi:hypothetical protein
VFVEPARRVVVRVESDVALALVLPLDGAGIERRATHLGTVTALRVVTVRRRFAAQPKGDAMITVKRSPEIEREAVQARSAYRSGDTAWVERHLAHGEVQSYGTAPGEVWSGRDAVLGLTHARVRELNDDACLVDDPDAEEYTTVEGFEAGDTAWLVAHSRFLLPDGSSVPLRGITILARDGDDWVSVHGSTHVLVPNELLVPGSPLATAAVS